MRAEEVGWNYLLMMHSFHDAAMCGRAIIMTGTGTGTGTGD